MFKWADYLISNYKYVSVNGKRYIEKAMVHKGINHSDNKGFWLPREKIIALISIGNTFCMLLKDKNKWIPGPFLNIFLLNGRRYLKTIENEIEEDALECQV